MHSHAHTTTMSSLGVFALGGNCRALWSPCNVRRDGAFGCVTCYSREGLWSPHWQRLLPSNLKDNIKYFKINLNKIFGNPSYIFFNKYRFIKCVIPWPVPKYIYTGIYASCELRTIVMYHFKRKLVILNTANRN